MVKLSQKDSMGISSDTKQFLAHLESSGKGLAIILKNDNGKTKWLLSTRVMYIWDD